MTRDTAAFYSNLRNFERVKITVNAVLPAAMYVETDIRQVDMLRDRCLRVV